MQIFYCKDEAQVELRKKTSANFVYYNHLKRSNLQKQTSTFIVVLFRLPIYISSFVTKLWQNETKLALLFSCSMNVSRMTLT